MNYNTDATPLESKRSGTGLLLQRPDPAGVNRYPHQPTTNHQPPTINYEPPTANRQPSTTNHEPPTTNPLPPMQNTTYLLGLTVLLGLAGACSSGSKKTNETAPPDADKHGCKGSAGYQWSAVQQRCVRLAEAGIKLASTGPDTAQTAYLVFASFDEDGQAEVFLPGQPGRILAKKAGDETGTWTLDTLTLSQWKGMYSLSGAKGTVLYEGHIETDEATDTTAITATKLTHR
ncbi:hypothetical protein [Fibrella aquatilis]|uniref:Uncharacterized protein n=1 Tax=Fibrella aquatilis TaxID=2817059 RepID=A0A939G472_9BACT|nr:hypothetical protein [Fibrella aquatilis]MBO0931576.1 hypothetical protein [Fibrella aquatilis]